MKVEVNRALFYQICYDATIRRHERFNIGTYREKQLHMILKRYFEPDASCHEVPYEGYIADIKRGDSITEIETGGFSGKGDKLAAFLPKCRVNLVYPVPHIRYIAWINPKTGDISEKRRSPKKMGAYDALFEMIRIRPYVSHPNLTVTAVLLAVDEYRMQNGWSRDGKKGSSRYERMPTDICEIVSFRTREDFLAYIPDGAGEEFTISSFAKEAGIPYDRANAVIKVMEERGVVTRLGKRGRSVCFRRAGA